MSDVTLYNVKCDCDREVSISVSEEDLNYTAVAKSAYDIDSTDADGTREIKYDGEVVGSLESGPAKWWTDRDDCEAWLSDQDVREFFRIVPVYMIDAKGVQTEESPETVEYNSKFRISKSSDG